MPEMNKAGGHQRSHNMLSSHKEACNVGESRKLFSYQPGTKWFTQLPQFNRRVKKIAMTMDT